jgi:excisionase family DNA binding protein
MRPGTPGSGSTPGTSDPSPEPKPVNGEDNKDHLEGQTRRTVDDVEQLLTPAEVAQLFRVNPKTVARWATTGHLGSIRTPGGHRRFRETEVSALFTALSQAAPTRPGTEQPRQHPRV